MPNTAIEINLLQLLGHLLSEAEILEKLVQSITVIAGIRTASSHKCINHPRCSFKELSPTISKAVQIGDCYINKTSKIAPIDNFSSSRCATGCKKIKNFVFRENEQENVHELYKQLPKNKLQNKTIIFFVCSFVLCPSPLISQIT